MDKRTVGPELQLTALEGDAASILERRTSASRRFMELLTAGDPGTRARLESVLTALMPDDGDLTKVERILDGLDEQAEILRDKARIDAAFDIPNLEPHQSKAQVEELLKEVGNPKEGVFDYTRFTQLIGSIATNLGRIVGHSTIPATFQDAVLQYVLSINEEVLAYASGTGPQGRYPETITIDHLDLVDLEYPNKMDRRYNATVVSTNTYVLQNLHRYLVEGMKRAALERLHPRRYSRER